MSEESHPNSAESHLGVRAKPAGADKESCTAFVSNLDYSITEQQIKDIFTPVTLI